LLRPLVPWCWRTGVTLALATALSLVWAPGHLFGFLSVGLAAALLYGLVVGPVAFVGPLEAYVRPRWNALCVRLSLSNKPSGTV
jgi:hypothetical protein